MVKVAQGKSNGYWNLLLLISKSWSPWGPGIRLEQPQDSALQEMGRSSHLNQITLKPVEDRSPTRPTRDTNPSWSSHMQSANLS